MSQENVEIARRANAAFNRGDDEQFSECLHREVEFRDLAHTADAPEKRFGREAVMALVSGWRETFDDFRAEVSEFLDVGDHVVCVTRWVGTGAASGIEIDTSQVDVYEYQDGKAIRATLAYPDKAAALEALGLSE